MPESADPSASPSPSASPGPAPGVELPAPPTRYDVPVVRYRADPTATADDLEPGDDAPLLALELTGAAVVQLYRLLGRVRGGTRELSHVFNVLDAVLPRLLPDVGAYRTRLDDALPQHVDLRVPDQLATHVFDAASVRYVPRATRGSGDGASYADRTDRPPTARR